MESEMGGKMGGSLIPHSNENYAKVMGDRKWETSEQLANAQI